MLAAHPRSVLSFITLYSVLAAATSGSEWTLGSFDLEDPLAPASIFTEDAVAGEPTRFEKRALGQAWNGRTSIAFAGSSGVGGMQMSVVDDDHIIILDKAMDNALLAKNGKSAWGSIYRISDQSIRALNLQTNSFCAGGGWLSNGTLVSVGGNPQQTYMNDAAGHGLAAVRLFTPCDDEKCDVYENPDRLRLTSARWYPSTVRLQDGSVMILGGMVAGGFNNAESTDNPTFEFFPPKGDGLQFYSKFLHDALDSNLFPITYLLPSGEIFVAANKMAMIYNWKTNTETRIGEFPNGVTVTYPASASNILLPLTIANGFQPEILVCGGTYKSVNLDANPATLSARKYASNLCFRMVINKAGIKRGWQTETMPEARLMGDALLMPDGKVLLINGAKTGIAGYGNVPDTVGASNAANPDYRPTLYDPVEASGKRFTTKNMPTSKFERLYHSSASLIPDGRVFVTGSNPNDKVSKKTYMTRYAVEMFSPPYMNLVRPNYYDQPANLLYAKSYSIGINVLRSAKVVQAVIMDLGYSTHGVHMSSRYVELEVKRTATHRLTITGPKDEALYPPGYAWLFILGDGVPSVGKRIMVGSGANPPSSAYASKNLLAKTKP